MKRPADSWEGAIVRGRDRRKGRVLDEERHRFPRLHLLLVHWDDDSVETADAHTVQMLRPPLGYTAVMPPLAEERGMKRYGPLWAFYSSAALVAVTLTMLALYLIHGAR